MPRRQFAYWVTGWLIGMAVGLALGQLATHLSAGALWALLVVTILPGALSLVGIAAGNALYLRHLRAEHDRHGRGES